MSLRIIHTVSNDSTTTSTAASSNQNPPMMNHSDDRKVVDAGAVVVVLDEDRSHDQEDEERGRVDEDYDEEEDRKPAAIPSSTTARVESTRNKSDRDDYLGNDLDENDDQHQPVENDADKDDEDDENESVDTQKSTDEHSSVNRPNPTTIPTSADGRPLSEYELLRLERMKRNREYLSRLGLDNDQPSQQQQPRKKKAKPKENIVVERRSSMTRRTKLQPIQYVGPRSIREMIQRAHGENGDEKYQKPSSKSKLTNLTLSTTTATNDNIDATGRGSVNADDNDEEDDGNNIVDGFSIPRKKGHQMDIFIFKEFRRLRSVKRQVVQKVERMHKMVQKEMKYWYHKKQNYDRKMNKKSFIDQYLLQQEQQQQLKLSQRDMLRHLDQRMPFVLQAMKRYDQSRLTQQRQFDHAVKRWEAEEKLKTFEACEWYPTALKKAHSTLDTALQHTSPMDPPPPRRSSRGNTADDSTLLHPIKTTPKKKRTSQQGRVDHECPMDDHPPPCLETVLEVGSGESSEEGGGKGTTIKRQAKNVGGWISPDFAKDIDRSWLECLVPPYSNKQVVFNLSTYVPQIGDIVLYYITGHRSYLDRYPDLVAKKNRGKKTRIPLWERANQLRGESRNGTTRPSEHPWWTDEWLDGLENGNLGDYPIICRVERTHAEFPPDPYSKVVESGSQSDGTILYFKKPKKFVKGEGKVPMRLSVTLRPLTPVMAPLITKGDSPPQSVELSVPPYFSVITFPCELEPFLVPFTWGYIKSQAVFLKQRLPAHNGMTNAIFVDSFVSLSGRDTMRIDDRQNDFEQFVSMDRTKLEKALDTHDLIIPTREARILIDLWYRQCSKKVVVTGVDNPNVKPSDHFKYLLRSTLPLWQSVYISSKRLYDVHKSRLSAWSLDLTVQGRDLSPVYFNWLDEPLRLKIEQALMGIMSSDSEAKELFYDPVTEDIAPSYHCAVPLGMSFLTVMQRLRVRMGYKSCYYRSVESVLADITWILECCLLYNSPESEVVDVAINVIDNTKHSLTNTIREYYKCLKSARTKDSERPIVMLQPRLWLNNFGRKFANGDINRDWLEVKLATASQTDGPNDKSQLDEKQLPFQVGDTILYSRNLHSRFITGHCSSLEYDQCRTLSTDYAIDSVNSMDDWEQGVIVSTHAVFPKILTRDEKDSFEAPAVLQCLGVKFKNDNCPFALFWRPCLVNSGDSDSRATCPGCGLTSSFVKLSPSEYKPDDHTIETTHQIQSILRCLDLLKRKCLSYIDPDKILVSPTATSSCKIPAAKVSRNSLPSYDKFLGKPVEPPQKKDQAHHGTRGTILKPKDDDDAIAALQNIGFLPRWISAARGGTTDEDLLRKLDMILPVTKLSLEYISVRIKTGFYRHTAAIENDVIEAYLSTVYSLLFEAATRKKAAISIRRISQLVAGDMIDNSNVSVEEQGYMSQIQRVRGLYGIALLAVLDVARTQRVFGLTKSAPPKRRINELENEDMKYVTSRQTLEHLVLVLRRENCTGNNSSTVVEKNVRMPSATLNIILSKTDHLIAKQGDAFLKVNIVCNGQTLSTGGHSSSKSNESYQTISFGPDDYEQNDDLARFLFSRPYRTGPCARCQVRNRTMVACRVVRKHTNLDCDWLTLFNKGIDFVDDQIKILDPSTLNGVPDVPADNAQKEIMSREKMQHSDAVVVVDNADNDPDPSEFFELANTMSTQASELLEAAKSYSTKPLRLSKKFIETAFPIDKSDGHFLYCVCCGLSGDLLCCDGCPNVVHAKCISLFDLPEGDWFCEICTAKKSGIENSRTLNTNDSKFSSIYSCDENGSALFDESKIDTTLSQLDILRRPRQTQKIKEIPIESTDNAENSAVAVTDDKEISDVEVVRNKTSSTVEVTNNKKISDSEVTERAMIGAPKDKQVIIVEGTRKSTRTRSDRISPDFYRPSMFKRRRIERAAV